MSLTSIAAWVGRMFGLARRSDKEPPGGNRAGMAFVPSFNSVAGVKVNEETALTYSAVFGCVRVVAETIAMMPWHAIRRGADGASEPTSSHPANRLLHKSPNPEMSAFQFRETLIAHVMLWGNGYAEIERNVAGQPIALWPITPDRVQPRRNDNGQIVYRINNYSAKSKDVPARDVFHLRGLGFDGLVGYSVIRLAARTVALGLAMDEGAAGFFASDATPGGVLTSPVDLNDEQQRRIIESFEARHRGPSKRGRVAILQGGLDWKQLGVPSKDAQFLESRQWQPTEVCRWFRVQPHKIADLSRSTFSNIEEENRSFVTDTLLPWASRLECEANLKLFGAASAAFSKINLNSLLRGNVAARTSFYTAMLDRGVLSINEVREKEDMEPIGPDGDKRFVPLNMQALDAANDKPQPTPPPQEPDESTEDEGEDGSPNLSPLTPIIDDYCQRAARREMHRVADMHKRLLDEAEFDESLNKFLAQHSDWLTESSGPLLQTVATIAGLSYAANLDATFYCWREAHLQIVANLATQTSPNWLAHACAAAAKLTDAIQLGIQEGHHAKQQKSERNTVAAAG